MSGPGIVNCTLNYDKLSCTFRLVKHRTSRLKVLGSSSDPRMVVFFFCFKLTGVTFKKNRFELVTTYRDIFMKSVNHFKLNCYLNSCISGIK